MSVHRSFRSRPLAALLAATALFAAISCGAEQPTLRNHAESPSAHVPAHWDYDAEGPDHWADLDRDFLTCRSGHEQSPVDLSGSARLDPADHIDVEYRPIPAVRLVNNGHTVQAEVPEGSGNRILVAGEPYELLQFHFHLPSEHTVDGRGAAMELHLVHKNNAGRLAVLGVLMEAGQGPSVFGPLLAATPRTADAAVSFDGPLDPSAFLPAARDQFRYRGSLTTPPCSEGVSWTVLSAPVAVAPEEIELYHSLFAHSNRPTQPLNGRTVTLAGN
ncbi:carbonic anhydrase [Nocardia amikacinitolerans]|uniref:carbonic anhydrase n=1 Tax=Nocardia amikacinitolerans TaxID=756689 RepID=A0A285KVG5_9NOCA|nr:carbonic anhydrase family protein [Nocardia amikacinitolerans]SNY75837.1 carbonic anhydrase [Nocardia amikacinitolerans]